MNFLKIKVVANPEFRHHFIIELLNHFFQINPFIIVI